MLFKRKQFLQIGSLATATLMMPKFLKAFERNALVPPGNKVMVVLQFSGGNDGLNTIIPIRNDIYYRSRPGLGIEKETALALTDEAGIHPALPYFKTLYDEGNLSIVNNVGYPNPDRSHFRSMDIWQSASQSNEYINTGWVGRYLDAQCANCDMPVQALEIDDVLSLAMKGAQQKGLALQDPKKLFQLSNDRFLKQINSSHEHVHEEATADYLYKTLSETMSSAGYIYEQSGRHLSTQTYPSTELGKDFKTISSLIMSDINTKVYYVSLGSFDTHVNQENQQARLFTQLNEAMTSFVKDLKSNNRFEDVAVMTFSEFGRRVAQNASGGTDHGTANNMFLISGGLKKKGFINELPDLQNLVDGDLKYTVDFKNVYATMLRNWLGADDALILGRKYGLMDFV